jgi:hypothetical protein
VKRLRRITFNLFTLTSLLVCAGVVAAWADSYRGTRMLETRRAGGHGVVTWTSDSGVAVVYWNRGPDGEFRWQRPTQRWQILGLTYIEGRLVRRKPWNMLVMPYWMPAMLTALVPIWWSVRRYKQQVREERSAARLCQKCGEALDARGACSRCAATTS